MSNARALAATATAAVPAVALLVSRLRRALAPPTAVGRESWPDAAEVEALLAALCSHYPHPFELDGWLSTGTVAMRVPPILNRLGRRVQMVRLSDGGTARLTWTHGKAMPSRGVVLVLPGLNNSSVWPFMQQTAASMCGHGFDACILDFRGTGGLALTSGRIACADSWRDLPDVLAAIQAAAPSLPIFAVGFSLGGLMLINHLSRAAATTPIVGAATVSAPLDLSAIAARLESSLPWRVANRVMATMAIKGLLEMDEASKAHLRGVDWTVAARSTCLREIEASVICPLHGWRDPEEYYAGCSPDISAVRVPLLLVHARDDPVIAADIVERACRDTVRRSPSMLMLVTETGGHIGYTGGLAAQLGAGTRVDACVATFFGRRAAAASGAAVATTTATQARL